MNIADNSNYPDSIKLSGDLKKGIVMKNIISFLFSKKREGCKNYLNVIYSVRVSTVFACKKKKKVVV